MNRRRAALGVVAVVIVASLGGWTAAVRADDPRYGSWAPGKSASVGAMSRIATHGHVGVELVEYVEHIADVTGGDSRAAVQSLRRLQQNLGVSRADLYAFTPGDGAVCLVVWKWSATCPTAESSRTPGVISIMNGGYPAGVNNSTVDVPTSFAGLVADSVRTVTFVNNGATERLTLRNNTFFTVPSEPAPGVTWQMELRISYRDGSSASIALPDPRPS